MFSTSIILATQSIHIKITYLKKSLVIGLLGTLDSGLNVAPGIT